MNVEQRYFTLVEVLIALAVLSLGILAGTGLLSSARERCRKAEAEWREQHAMTQAAEYFLLAGTEQEMPERSRTIAFPSALPLQSIFQRRCRIGNPAGDWLRCTFSFSVETMNFSGSFPLTGS